MFAYLGPLVVERERHGPATLRLDQQHEPVAHRERLARIAHGDPVDDLVRPVAREAVDDAPANPGGAIRVAVVRDRQGHTAVALEVARLAGALVGKERDAPVLDT